MASARSELLDAVAAAFNARDLDGFMDFCTETFELESRFSRVGGAVFRGRGGVVSWWNDLAETWDPIEIEVEDSADVGSDRTVILCKLHGTGRESRLPLDESVAQRWHWSGDLLRKLEYMDRDEAELVVRATA